MTATKADFDDIYDQSDDFQYFRTLSALGYEIPQHGADMFAALLAERDLDRPTLLDVCCSYGVGGVLLKTDLRLEDLYESYSAAGQDRAAVVAESVRLRHEHGLPDAPQVFGLDVAPNAVSFALDSGALDRGFVEDLESGGASPELTDAMAEVDMITTTGGIGYVTGRTLGTLVDASPTTPWVAAFCLRAYDYSLEKHAMAERGMITEKSATHFRQRRFVDVDEQRWASEQVRGLGLDTTGLEDTGWYFADFYLSRPAEDADERPLDSLIAS